MSSFNVNEAKFVIPLDEIYGGTGTNTYVRGNLLYGSSSTTLSKLPIGATGQLLTVSSGIPNWSNAPNGATGNTGSTGATGPTGRITSNYLFSTVNTNQTVNNNFSVVFTDPPVLFNSSAFTYTIAAAAAPNGDAYFTVLNSGLYLISFRYCQEILNPNPYVFGISVNGIVNNDSGMIPAIGGADGVFLTYVKSLNANDQLRLVNNSGGSRNLATAAGSGNAPVVSITIVRLS